MLAIGVGGLTVVGALCGSPYHITHQNVVGIRLEGTLPAWSSAKDIALHLLGTLSVKGGVGKILEFYGPGVASLSVFERSTICNMGAEAGATASLFPSDTNTRDFLKSFGREEDWRPICADDGAAYDEEICIHLSEIEPMVALPHSPDNVRPVRELEGLPLDQVCIGSCTNASYPDIAIVANIWNNRRLPQNLDVCVNAGTRKTLYQLMCEGKTAALLEAGARLLEPCCGPCNAAGMSPGSGKTSLRTFNRNFKGRSGTADALVYLCSPQTAAVSALSGKLTDPRSFGAMPTVAIPSSFAYAFRPPRAIPDDAFTVPHGPNIKPMPMGKPVPDSLTLKVCLIAGDNITTDHILPGGAELLALRSNVPDSVPYVFSRIDPSFGKNTASLPPEWCVVAGSNFGQGSSREHAVMVPLYLGMRAVLAKSFARIYRTNLINFGILPLEIVSEDNSADISLNDELSISGIHASLKTGEFSVINGGKRISCRCVLSPEEQEMLVLGGVLRKLSVIQ